MLPMMQLRSSHSSEFNLPKRYLVLFLILLSALVTGCTETVHASIWIQKYPASTDSGILKQTLAGAGWNADQSLSSGEVVFRNPSLSNCYLTQGPVTALPIEIVFVKVGAKHFDPADIAAYRQIAGALVAALGDDAVRAENIYAKG